jgi:hypothetical protein
MCCGASSIRGAALPQASAAPSDRRKRSGDAALIAAIYRRSACGCAHEVAERFYELLKCAVLWASSVQTDIRT